MTYPPPGQPWQPGQPDPNQPQYGGYAGAPAPDPYAAGPYGPAPGQQYGGDPQYGHAPYQQESYTTEPPMSGQPYQQPYSGAGYDPNYGAPQPGYNAGYGAPQGYQQPGYQQAGYAPVQQPPSFVTPTVPQGNRGGMIALIAGGAVLLLLLVGIGGALLLRSGDDEPTVAASEGATATAGPTGTPSPTPNSNAEYPARLDLAQNVAGLTKVDDPALNETANSTALQMKNSTNADSTAAAYYAPNGDLTKVVGLVGVLGRMSNPERQLDGAFNSELTVSGVQTVNAGPLGGYMKCGNTVTGGQTMTVCGWADGGSLVLGIFLNRSLTDSSVLFRQIRGEILKRG